MGINSTNTAWGFQQFGSTFLSGDGSQLDLDGSTAKYYVCAITMISATKFQELQILDGGTDLGMGNTHFISTEDTQTLDSDWEQLQMLATMTVKLLLQVALVLSFQLV